jgi:hypothetical protein
MSDLKKLLAAATARPWRVKRYECDRPRIIARVARHVVEGFQSGVGDLKLIVAAVNALPQLLDVVEALEQASRDLNAAADGAPLASSRLAGYQAANALTALRAALAGGDDG